MNEMLSYAVRLNELIVIALSIFDLFFVLIVEHEFPQLSHVQL